MKVLVIGSGGREHALVWKISQSFLVDKIYCAPGNAGTEKELKCENVDLNTIEELLNFAKNKEIDFTIVGPEVFLVEGIVDKFKENNLKIFGPSRQGARLEGSKIFSKNFMKKYGVKTAKYKVFDNSINALKYIEKCDYPIVIKADGLALGKGVYICRNKNEALKAVNKLMIEDVFQGSGLKVIMEEYLEGVEASILSITDGETIIPFISSKDHKQIFNGNKGPNTGGMGAVVPNFNCTDKVLQDFNNNILVPTLNGIKNEKIDYVGTIFFGVMITKKGVYLLEYNVRMGDPETQGILPLMENDYLELMLRAIDKKLKGTTIKWKNEHCCCITLVSKGYPKEYKKGFEIKGLNTVKCKVFIAGAKYKSQKLVTSGGRVLNVVASGESLDKAKLLAYKEVKKIDFCDCYYRSDIGDVDRVRRVIVEKKPLFNVESKHFLNDIRENLGIVSVNNIRILNCYDVEGLSLEEYYKARNTIFSDNVVDCVYNEEFKLQDNETYFAVEYIEGQYDQRADSAIQCIKILTENKDIKVACKKIIVIKGNTAQEDIEKIKKYCINSVDSKETTLEKPFTLNMDFESAKDIKTIGGFINKNDNELKNIKNNLNLTMSFEDLKFCREYFKNKENRNPTITELKVIDTYWSDHCRHTTFNTKINKVEFKKGFYVEPIKEAYDDYIYLRQEFKKDNHMCFMDIANIVMKDLMLKGLLNDVEVSNEINACSIECDVDIDGRVEKYLVMFKNETHNHPTEIEPFGGAATCLGGAIRDPLSGRSYVYGAMRISGASDPRKTISETLKGKMPQRHITLKASEGYSSYGNQMGVPTGYVKEFYDEDFVAKRMEIGAVIGAVPKKNVVRSNPVSGDCIILVGGRTGRDGCGGATGSSKKHDENSISTCSAQVQKGNPLTERKLQRLFRNSKVSKIIKRCNDFGAGGVSVAIGELSDGISINLDLISTKYKGLDGTELAISESQERMAVVVNCENVDKFIKYSQSENLEAIEVGKVTDNNRLTMYWRGKVIVDISRDFLNANGAERNTDILVESPKKNTYFSKGNITNIKDFWINNIKDLNICSQRGLIEKFDSTIGSGTVVMPLGGKYGLTPSESMCFKIPVLDGDTNIGTIMSAGYNPKIGKWSPFHGAVYSIVDAITKVVVAGGDYKNIRLTLQEYFGKMGENPKKWGIPFAALLGAFYAQRKLSIPAIGGKDSMSGSFKDIDVPPTLVAFAVDVVDSNKVITPEFKKSGSKVLLLITKKDKYKLPIFENLKQNYKKINELINNKLIFSAHTVGFGGIAESISKMSFGNKIGINIKNISKEELFEIDYGSMILELSDKVNIENEFSDLDYKLIGITESQPKIVFNDLQIDIDELIKEWEKPLESVFKTRVENKKSYEGENVEKIEKYIEKNNKKFTEVALGLEKKTKSPAIKLAKPKVYIPIFPGTNCEYDLKKAFDKAGGTTEIGIFKNLNHNYIEKSIDSMVDSINNSQIVMLSGGFSAGDEPDGSGKFMATVFRNEKVKNAIMELLNNRDGLILGICNGFQVLIKLGLVPYGEIRDINEKSPTLTYNEIGRHVSKIVNTKIVSKISPWFNNVKSKDIYKVPISHGEGRFICTDEMAKKLFKNGQVATQYVDLCGNPTYDIEFNPNGSMYAIEGITSFDGRVLGKMGHSERIGQNLYKNVVGENDMNLFKSGIEYFK